MDTNVHVHLLQVRGSRRAQPTGYNLVLPAGELAEWLKAAVC